MIYRALVNLVPLLLVLLLPISDSEAVSYSHPPLFTTANATTDLCIVFDGAFLSHHSMAVVNRELAAAALSDGSMRITLQIQERGDIFTDEHVKQLYKNDPSALNFLFLYRSPGYCDCSNRVTIRHRWPVDHSPVECGRLIVIQPWEYGDACPIEWIKSFNSPHIDQLWVPSSWNKRQYVTAGVEEDKIAVVPNGINANRWKAAPSHAQGHRFRFLFVGGVIWRKGIEELVQAFTAAFSPSDNAELYIKVDSVYFFLYLQSFNAHSFYKSSESVKKVREAMRNASNIVYSDDDLGDEDLMSLYASSDAVVLPSHGEGFGNPALEGMAAGVRVIVPDSGPFREFCGEDYCAYIPSKERLVALSDVGGLQLARKPRIIWYRIEDLVTVLKQVYHERNSNVEEARRHVLSYWTWSDAWNVAKRHIDTLYK